MFDANAYARNSLVNYERNQDGLSFLHSLIKDHHTDLRSTAHRANITDAYTLPKFDDEVSIWKYINLMQIYFTEVNKQSTQVDILRLIHAQLCRDPRFTKAAESLQTRISEYKTGNGSVPEEYRLKDIARTIMDMYDPSDREKLSEPRRPPRFGVNTMQINRMRTRSQRQAQNDFAMRDYENNQYKSKDKHDEFLPSRRTYDQHRNNNANDQHESNRKPHRTPVQDQRRTDTDHAQQTDQNKQSETLCIGCWTYGHPVEECTKTGAHIAIDAFLQRCSDQTKKEIKAAYRKNRKEAHERYLRAYKRRQELRKKIRRLEYQYNQDSNGLTNQQDRAAMAELDALKVSCIRVAHDENPDIEFGSLDNNYIDHNEPMLQFDPSVEDFPIDNE